MEPTTALRRVACRAVSKKSDSTRMSGKFHVTENQAVQENQSKKAMIREV